MASPFSRVRLVVPALLALAAIALVGPWHDQGMASRIARGIASTAVLASFGLTCWGLGKAEVTERPQPSLAPDFGPRLDRLDRIATALEARPVQGAAVPDSLATIADAIAGGRWAEAEALLAAHPDHPDAARYARQVASSKESAGSALRDELEAAQAVNDPERVLEIHRGLAAVLTAEALEEIEARIAKWFVALIMRRLRGGTVRPDVAELAAKVAERFPRSVEGASLRASLGTLRRSAGLCPRCARPYRGIAEACPACLKGSPVPESVPEGAAWDDSSAGEDEVTTTPATDGLDYPEFLNDPT
jgi:hypothetical protein